MGEPQRDETPRLRLIRSQDGDGATRSAMESLRNAQDFGAARVPMPDATAQTRAAREYLAAVRAGAGLNVPWPDIDQLAGLLLPGWFVTIGARGKGGKTTMMLNLARAWARAGRRVVYIGTE